MTPARHYLPGGLAFVDIETTGGPAQRESITEIGIVQVDEDGVREWSTLVRPESRIPDYIQRLTGIDDDMVADAPRFADIADEVFDRLDGRLFVAHNARFDHGHLRAALRRAGLDMRPQVLCTVKLSRRLFPDHRRHSLDHLIERHGLAVADRHRALGDAQLLWQFWQKIHERFPPGHLEATVRELIGHPSLPPHLDPEQIAGLPDTPGVYLFYGERGGEPAPAGRSDGADAPARAAPGAGAASPSAGRARTGATARGVPPQDLPLYIGKSTRLRSRVLSHFAADHSSDRELSLSQQVRRIEWIETAGEIGARPREPARARNRQPPTTASCAATASCAPGGSSPTSSATGGWSWCTPPTSTSAAATTSTASSAAAARPPTACARSPATTPCARPCSAWTNHRRARAASTFSSSAAAAPATAANPLRPTPCA